MKEKVVYEQKQRDDSGLKDKLIELSFYTACAGTISIVESLIPKPFPFLKIGLANIVLILLIMQGKELSAVIVLFGKVLLSGLFVGTLLMPTTLIALGSGLVSLLIMAIMVRVKLGLSWVGISIIAAITHNLMQLVIVRTIIIYSNSIFELIPLLLILGIVTGTATGIMAIIINQRLTWSFNETKN